jgi:hypothetical protein
MRNGLAIVPTNAPNRNVFQYLVVVQFETRQQGSAHHRRIQALLCSGEDAFGPNIDYAMLQKIYGKVKDTPETRYSPAVCMGARKVIIKGKPDHAHISTSFVERQNLTMRIRCAGSRDLLMGFPRS